MVMEFQSMTTLLDCYAHRIHNVQASLTDGNGHIPLRGIAFIRLIHCVLSLRGLYPLKQNGPGLVNK
jgi:hypothetical protein